MSRPPSPRPASRQLLAAATLPCGADVDLLLEQAADGRGADYDGHQAGCVHCQAALAELAALWTPLAELATRPVPPPPGITAAVMRQIRARVRDVWHTLEPTGLGSIRIAARIVAAVARDTARTIPGVRVALGRSTHSTLAERATLAHRYPHAAAGVLGGTAVVDLAIAVSYGQPAHQIARQIQQQVIATLHEQTGLRTAAVNVTIDDVLTDGE